MIQYKWVSDLPYGYNGKILRVNLSDNKIAIERPSEVFYRRYLGGWGFIAYFLLKEVPPGIDPLSPMNKLIFAPGVITGAPIAGSGRNAVGAKSPLTGAFGASEAGGYFGAELKHAGFDAVIVEGKAEKPVYLWIHDGEAEIRDASHLWGMYIAESQNAIRKELGDPLIRTAQIGPGGERLVRYACIINDLKYTAGRTGMGAVMGSKNLKAIAVRGSLKTEVADRETLRRLSKWLLENLQELCGSLHEYGTGRNLRSGVESGNLPTHNFRDGEFKNPEGISSETWKKKGILIGMEGCYACPIRCKKICKVEEPYTVNPEYGGPEYETMAALGSCCGIDDGKAVCKAHELCQKYTLDTISTGVTIAFAMECYENGLLTKKDTEGIELKFGNANAMLKMIELIGERKGIGDLLAEGSLRAAKKIGGEAIKFAVQVKGQEVPMHEPRLKRSLALGYAVSPTGADHVHNLHDIGLTTEEGFKTRYYAPLRAFGILEPIPLELLNAKKIRALIYHVNWRILLNCLLMCIYPPWSVNQIVEIVRAVTGWDTSSWELMKVGERSLNLARVFNLREGFTEKDDWLPDRFFHPTTSGPLSKVAVNEKTLERAKHTYYRMMGWDENTGTPTRGKLEELDISWVVDEYLKYP